MGWVLLKDQDYKDKSIISMDWGNNHGYHYSEWLNKIEISIIVVPSIVDQEWTNKENYERLL